MLTPNTSLHRRLAPFWFSRPDALAELRETAVRRRRQAAADHQLVSGFGIALVVPLPKSLRIGSSKLALMVKLGFGLAIYTSLMEPMRDWFHSPILQG